MFSKKSSTPSKQQKLTLKNPEKSQKIYEDVNESSSSDVIDTTPDHSKKLKLRISKINSRLKSSNRKSSHESSKKLTMNSSVLNEISPIPKAPSNSRKVSLKKPLKRRCSFSPTDDAEKKKHKVIKSEENQTKTIDNTEGLKELAKYLPQIIDTERITKLQDGLFKVSKDSIKNEQNVNKLIDVSNDSLLDLVDGDELIGKSCPSNQKLVNSSDIIMDNSFDDMVLDAIKTDDVNPFYDVSIVLWNVQQVSVKEYANTGSQIKKERILQLQWVNDEYETAVCHLRDDWYVMEIEKNDIVHVSNLGASTKRSILDNNSKDYITIFPSTLIAGTTIATGITCERQAVLNTRFRMEGQNEVMLVGTLTHELFQWAVTSQSYSVSALEEQMNELLKQHKLLETFYQLNIDESQVAAKIKDYLPAIEQWSKAYLQTGNKLHVPRNESNVTVGKIVDIEENIWSPFLGFKGKVDVSVEVNLHKKPLLKNAKNSRELAPLELKTGKMWSSLGSVEHRAQVAVYCLLMRERHKVPIDSGLLYYIKTNHMQQVPIPDQEKRAIIIKRNEIARHMTLEKETQILPELLRNKRMCSRCPQNQVCMMHHISREGGEAKTSGVQELCNNLISHLKKADFEYFAKWYELILLEAHYDIVKNQNRFIWMKSSKKRESRGVCFSGLLLAHQDVTSDKKYHYTFIREKNHFNKDYPMTNIPMVVGDRVIISRENERVFNETTGYILDVSSNQLTISAHQGLTSTKGVLYRIDKDETLDSMTTPLSNLAKLFQVGSPNDDKIRDLVIHKKKPEFTNEIKELPSRDNSLNEAQRTAVTRCLQAKDYVMILGMPGSGKSTTTAVLVESLVASGKRVLLTSYTHSAVDTILLKLLQNGFKDFVRFGQSSRVHPSLKEYTNQEKIKMFTTTKQIADFYDSQRVYASTCLGVNNAIVSKQQFDYCIVDEASQITQPVCLGAVRLANVFILIGDHNQLPPLVQSDKAKLKGMDTSLFKSLSDSHPEGVVTLNYQYRMNTGIMSLSNHLVYHKQMKCGNEAIANSRLQLSRFGGTPESDLKAIIDPNNPVVFVNTDNLPDCKEEIRSKRLVNIGEASLCKRVITGLLSVGLCGSKIGIICPYRHQLNILREKISSVNIQTSTEIEIETIDKYQGKDKECILVTFVRSNDKQEVGELLIDWRRVNVALTRAKNKLILIGSRKTIVGSSVLSNLLELVDTRKWCMQAKHL